MPSIEYKTSNIPPPVYERAKELWGVDFDKGTVFTYGDTVHSKSPLSADLLAHELVHVRQQTLIGRDEWWTPECEPDMRDVADDIIGMIISEVDSLKQLQQNDTALITNETLSDLKKLISK